jgi:hypothetical protein
MAAKKQNEQQELEELIDVGDADEEEVEIELRSDKDENPNIADTLETIEEHEEEIEEPEEDTRTPEQKLAAFLDANPDVSEYRAQDIQGRIKDLTWKQKEAERQQQAAIEYAQNVQKENAELKSKQQHQDGVFINEHKGRLEAQLGVAKKQLREAHEAGDPDLIAEAQTLLSKTAAELTQAEQTETRFQRFVQTQPEETITPYQPQPSPEARPQVDPKAQAWAQRNEWFGEDETMTQAALSIHQQLIQESYMPTGDGYYAELDNRMRKNFPDKFQKPAERTNNEIHGNQVVTPPSRSVSRKPRGKHNVRLTPSQVAIAKKLGVPLEEYAKYVPPQ